MYYAIPALAYSSGEARGAYWQVHKHNGPSMFNLCRRGSTALRPCSTCKCAIKETRSACVKNICSAALCMRQLQGLPGAEACEGYQFVEERGGWESEAQRLTKEAARHTKAGAKVSEVELCKGWVVEVPK